MFKGCKNLETYYCPQQADDIYGERRRGMFIALTALRICCPDDPVNGTFYFEGKRRFRSIAFTRENCFAFSYIDYNSETHQYKSLNKYELTVQDLNVTGKTEDLLM